MSNISDWSTSAVSNNQAPPNGWPENQAPSSVNDTARETHAAIARWYQDTNGELVSGGSVNDYTLTSNSNHAALSDQSVLVFRADRANTGATTLAVDGLAKKDMVRADGSALVADDIDPNQLVAVAYNSNQDKYFVLSDIPREATETAAGEAEIATQGETDSGTNDTRFVTPKKLSNLNLGQDLSADGHQKLPGGLILQWGDEAITSNPQTITFPLEFPNAALQVTASPDLDVLATDSSVAVGSLSTTGFDARIWDSSSGNAATDRGIRWMAIGH